MQSQSRSRQSQKKKKKKNKLLPMQKDSWECPVLASFPSSPYLFNTYLIFWHQSSGSKSIFFITFSSMFLCQDSLQNSAKIVRDLQKPKLILVWFVTCQSRPGRFRNLNTSEKYHKGFCHCQSFQKPLNYEANKHHNLLLKNPKCKQQIVQLDKQ